MPLVSEKKFTVGPTNFFYTFKYSRRGDDFHDFHDFRESFRRASFLASNIHSF